MYGPTKEILEERLNSVVAEADPAEKSRKFKESRDATLSKAKAPLPGFDTEQDTRRPFKNVVWSADPKIVRVGYRSFDRQYLIADSRLMGLPTVWLTRGVDSFLGG